MTDSTDTAEQRMRTALAGGETFTRAQLAHIVALAFAHADDLATFAYRAGELAGRTAVAELSLDAISHPSVHAPFSERELRIEEFRQRSRREYDTAAGHPWLDDHPGGPVPVWEATSPSLVPAPVSTSVVKRRGTLVWADA